MKSGGKVLVRHYESCFEKHGDCAKGVDWPSEEGARLRHRVMAELMQGATKSKLSILDYGCGLGHFYDFLLSQESTRNVAYLGVDASQKFVEACQKKFKNAKFVQGDILDGSLSLQNRKFDFIVLNGVLTEKRELSQKKMVDLFKSITMGLFPYCKKGLAFNVMSKQVDWERTDLFHLSFDLMADFVAKNLSRHFCIRHDYGLYEYTVYVFKKPRRTLWPK